MARNIDYWYKFLAEEKDAQPTIVDELQPEDDELKNLRTVLQLDESPSETTFWRCATLIIAAGCSVLDRFFDQHKDENTFLVKKRGQVGQDFWWIGKALEFQYNHQVEILTDEYGLQYTGYSTIDEAAKLVKLVAIVKGDTADVLKVANQAVDKTPIPLTTAQRDSFRAYVSRVKPLGTTINVVATQPDSVLYNITIEYDAQGDEDELRTACIAALQEYHRVLDFNGKIRLSKVGDAVQDVSPMVLDYKINLAQIKPYGGAYVAFDFHTDTVAGYSVYDLSSTITFIKKI